MVIERDKNRYILIELRKNIKKVIKLKFESKGLQIKFESIQIIESKYFFH